jgi:nucleotide-binding universal stress UspA family protein
MKSLEHILVPTDFSPHAATAAALGLALAERAGGVLALFHVNELPDFSLVAVEPMYIPAQAWERLAGQHAAEIDSQFAALRAELAARSSGAATIEHDYHRAGVVEGIVDAAVERRADLIVIGSAGSGGPVEYFFGDVASRVAQRAPCPVLVTKPGAAAEIATRGVPKRALVAVDYSPYSRPTAEAAAAVVVDGGIVDVLHVYQEPAAFALERSMHLEAAPQEFLAAIESTRETEIDRMREFLDEVELGDRNVNSLIEIGSPARRILTVAERHGVDLIALGSHGRHGAEYITGTVADRVVRAAQVPVLLIPEAMVAAD